MANEPPRPVKLPAAASAFLGAVNAAADALAYATGAAAEVVGNYARAAQESLEKVMDCSGSEGWASCAEPGPMLRALPLGLLTDRKVRLLCCAAAEHGIGSCLLGREEGRPALRTWRLSRRLADAEYGGCKDAGDSWKRVAGHHHRRARHYVSMAGHGTYTEYAWRAVYGLTEGLDRLMHFGVLRNCALAAGHHDGGIRGMDAGVAAEEAWQAELVRCHFGDPWRPLLSPNQLVGRTGAPTYALRAGASLIPAGQWHDVMAWQSGTVPRMAARAYADEEGLGPLTDALEEAGLGPVLEWDCEGEGTHRHEGKAGEVVHGVLYHGNPKWPHHHHDEKCPRRSVPNPLLTHLRSPFMHRRGCWALDLILGRE